MDLMEIINRISVNKPMHKSKNYYYDTHQCPQTGENIKVSLDNKLGTDNNDKIIKFGFCPNCNELYYCEDFESSQM